MKHQSPRRRNPSTSWFEPLECRSLLSAPPISYVDGDGTTVKISLSGNGAFTLDGNNLNITGSDQGTKLTISTKGGDGRTTLGSIIASGAMKEISASKTDLTGNITLGGSAKTFKLGNMLPGAQKLITIGGTDNAQPVKLTFERVTDMSIESGAPISKLDVEDWDDTDGNDLIRTSNLKDVDSDEDFAPNGIIVADEENEGYLGTIDAEGIVSGSWYVDGDIKTIEGHFTTPGFRVNARGKVGTFKTKYEASGLIAAYDIGKVDINGAAINLTVLAGADLGTDMALGGIDLARDLFFRGTFNKLSVDDGAVGSTFAAGLVPVNDVIGDSNDYVTGKTRSIFKSISVKEVADVNTTFAAGKFGKSKVGGTKIDPNGDPRFLLASTVPDEDPPVIVAQLRNNTGDPNDLITSDPSIIGRVTDLGSIDTFRLGIDRDELSDFDSIKKFIEYDGTFELLRSDIEKINKGPFTTFDDPDDGDEYQLILHTINLVAKDDTGNTTAIFRIPFFYVP